MISPPLSMEQQFYFKLCNAMQPFLYKQLNKSELPTITKRSTLLLLLSFKTLYYSNQFQFGNEYVGQSKTIDIIEQNFV